MVSLRINKWLLAAHGTAYMVALYALAIA